MAEVQDVELSEEVGEIEAVEKQQEEAKPVAAPEEDDIPDEFKGKSVKELVGMTLFARKEMGRQANEVGEIRKLADELIKSQLQPKQPVAEPVKEVDFFENPQEAIRRAVESNPKVQAAEMYAIQAQREMAKQKLQSLHPDMGEIVQDQGFRQWVQASPVRQQLLQAADQGYDVAAAHELLSTFKELKAIKVQQYAKDVDSVEKTARNQALKAAAVDSGGTGESSQKVFYREELMDIARTDPDKYARMNDAIIQAYREGRVKSKYHR